MLLNLLASPLDHLPNPAAELPSKLGEITAKNPLVFLSNPTRRLGSSLAPSLVPSASFRSRPLPRRYAPRLPFAPRRRSRPPASHSSPTPLRSLPHPSHLPINKVTVSLLPPLQSPANQQGHRLPSAHKGPAELSTCLDVRSVSTPISATLKIGSRGRGRTRSMMRTSPFSAWLQRCRMLLVRGEATFMAEEHWTVMICFTSKSKWRPRKMQSVFFAVQRSGHLLLLRAATLADSAPALPAALCVDPRPKSDIRQRDLLKNIVGIKPKRPKVCSPPQAAENDGPKRNLEGSVSKMSSCQNGPKPAEGTESRPQNVTGSLLGLAYESSDEE